MKHASDVTGSLIRRFRASLNLSQQEFAERLKVAKKTVYNWEARGDDALPDQAQARFVRALQSSVPSRIALAEIPSEVLASVQPVVDEDEVSVLAQQMTEAASRLQAAAASRDANEVARDALGLATGIESLMDTLDVAVRLGVHPAIIKSLAQGAVDALVDAGLVPLLSRLDQSDRVMALLQRATGIYRESVEKSPRREKVGGFDFSPLPMPRLVTGADASGHAADGEDAALERSVDPDD
ncbi:helix-turn-helix domain-containing protein [Cellulomonas sp. ACRRI]|uniref:helix-turn-helix domain-containing protein n=1 Tax=Cellulomonas sp. ACRRI TaxID=2918188 RepID=UPI001EF2B925|nr:helix-turn-helix domain-containing protein [Cellulomonas sp. ACRRI]MCG7284990.1 helix-turn-helix domain-containing protein [Cellulomonas sp. ACRRI]